MSRSSSQNGFRHEHEGQLNPPISIDEALGRIRQSQPMRRPIEAPCEDSTKSNESTIDSSRYVSDTVRSLSPSSRVQVTRSAPFEHNLSILEPMELSTVLKEEASMASLIQISSLDPIPAAPESNASLFHNLHVHQQKTVQSRNTNAGSIVADADQDKLARRKHAMQALAAGLDLEREAADAALRTVQSTQPVGTPQPFYLLLQPLAQLRLPSAIAPMLRVPVVARNATVHFQLSFFDLNEREFLGNTSSTSASPLLAQRAHGVYFFVSCDSPQLVLVVEAVLTIRSESRATVQCSLGWTVVIPFAATPNARPVVTTHSVVTDIADISTQKGELLTTPLFSGSPRALLALPSTNQFHTLTPAFGLRIQHTLYHCRNLLPLQHLLKSHKAYRADATHHVPGLLPDRQLHPSMHVTTHPGSLPAPHFLPSIAQNQPVQQLTVSTPVVHVPATYTADLLTMLQHHYTLYENPLFTRGTPTVSARKLLIGVHNGEKFLSNPVILPLYNAPNDMFTFQGNADVLADGCPFYADKSVFLYMELQFEISWSYAHVLDRLDLAAHRENSFDQCIASLSLPLPCSSVVFRGTRVFKDEAKRVVDFNTGAVQIDENGVKIKNTVSNNSLVETTEKYDFLTHDHVYLPNTRESVPLSAVMHRSIGTSLSGARRYGFHGLYDALEEQATIYLHTQVNSPLYTIGEYKEPHIAPAVALVDKKLVVVDNNLDGSTLIQKKQDEMIPIQTKKSVIKIKATRKMQVVSADSGSSSSSITNHSNSTNSNDYIPSYTNPNTKTIVTSRPLEQRAFVLHRNSPHYFELQLQNIISTDFVALLTVHDPAYDMSQHIAALRQGTQEARPEIQVLDDVAAARVYRAKGDPKNYVVAIGPWGDQTLAGLPAQITPTLLNGPDAQPNTFVPAIVAKADQHTRCYLVIIPHCSTISVPFVAHSPLRSGSLYAPTRDVYITASTQNGQAIGQLKLSIIQP